MPTSVNTDALHDLGAIIPIIRNHNILLDVILNETKPVCAPLVTTLRKWVGNTQLDSFKY